MRKLFLIFVSLLLVGVAGTAGADRQWGDHLYELRRTEEGKAAWLTGYTGQEETVILPSEVDGYKVAGVDYSSHLINKRPLSIKHLIVPEGVMDLYIPSRIGAREEPPLESITLPNSFAVKGGLNPLSLPRLKAIKVAADHPSLAVVDGVLFTKPEMALVCFPSALERETYVIPEECTEIGYQAFSDAQYLREVTIPESVKSIWWHAFSRCDSLEKAVINAPLEKLPDSLFTFCSNLKEVTLPQSVKEIGSQAFSHCSALTTINLPEGLTTIGNSAFSFVALTEIKIPDSVKKIEQFAFAQNEKLREIVLPMGLTEIPQQTFLYCTALERLAIPESVTTIGPFAFGGCIALKTLHIPASVTAIDERAFLVPPVGTDASKWNEVMKQNLTLVVEEGSYAQTFAWEQGFTCLLNEACEAALPEGTFIYQVLGDQTARIIGYQGTARQLTLPESLQGHPVTAIGENAFAKQPLEQVILPEGLKAIGHGAFWDCTLREVRIPDSVTRVEGNPFLWCDELETIDISPDQPVLALINGVLYHKGEKKLVFCSPALGKTNLEIPRGIRVIGIGAVEMNRELETLLLPETLERIEAGAFSTCTALKEIILPEGVTELAPRSFADCSALKNVTVPDSVIAIGDGCFTGAAVTLTVGRDSCAREYARANGLDYTYPDALDWLNE